MKAKIILLTGLSLLISNSLFAACGGSNNRGKCRNLNTEPSSDSSSSSSSSSGNTTVNSAYVTSNSSCKRGVAFPSPTTADLTALAKSVRWWYGWSPNPAPPAHNRNIEYIPMIWGTKQYGQADAIPNGVKILLSFNEPNFKTQANLSPEQAAAEWPKIQQIAKNRNLKIVGPALNYCEPASDCWEADPFVYYNRFTAACKSCKIDYIAVHWYNCDVASLKNYIGKWKKYNKPIWVTEFACGVGDTSIANQKKYMKEAVQYLESEPAVARYAWFSGRSPAISTANLLAGDGQLTELGQQYISEPTSSNCK